MAILQISNLTPPANTVGFGITGFSLTGSNAQSFVDLAGTWNTTGTPTAFKFNVTDTASNAASNFFDWQVGGVSKIRGRKDGAFFADSLTLAGNATVTGLIQIAGTTSSFPALKRDGTTVKVRLADDSGDADFAAKALTLSGDLTLSTKNIVTDITTGTKIGTATDQKIGFFGATPVVQGAEITDELTSITHTAPGTPDYAIQDLTDTGGFGFATKDEGNTVLSVIANLQARVNDLEARLAAYGLLADAD